jgi:DNA-binding NarL/FixJ family response regulator
MHKPPIKIMIVDDQVDLARQIQSIFEADQRFVVIANLPSAAQIVHDVQAHQPDLVLMDINMPDIDGIEALKLIRQAGLTTPVLMQTIHELDSYIFESILAGGNGYVVKSTPPDRLLEYAVEATLNGAPFSPGIAYKVLNHVRAKEQTEPDADKRLSERHIQVIELLMRGFSYQEIADELHISKDTVGYHVRGIYANLHIKSRTELQNPTGWWHKVLNFRKSLR